jgi:hypothetical protein
MIKKFIPLLEEDGYDWFQQDGTTCHTSDAMIFPFRDFLGDCHTSGGLWPTNSPDFTSPNFYLWGHLKGVVYTATTHIQ